MKPLNIKSLDQFGYYPFGMLQPDRHIERNDTSYRYGFNRQEKVDELCGLGNHYTSEFWEYDPRIGRRWNIDPVRIPWESPFATFNNNPIYFSDPIGLDGEGPNNECSGDINNKGQIYGHNGTTGKDGWTNPLPAVDIDLKIGKSPELYEAQSPGKIGDPARKVMENVKMGETVVKSTGDILGDGSKAGRALEIASAVTSGIELVNTTRKLANNNLEGRIGDLPSPADMAGVGGAMDLALKNNTTEGFQETDRCALQGINGDYAKFREWANKKNAELSSSNGNTIIVIYTSAKLGENLDKNKIIINNASPSIYVSYNRIQASRDYNTDAHFMYWGHLSDFNNGTFAIPPDNVIEVK